MRSEDPQETSGMGCSGSGLENTGSVNLPSRLQIVGKRRGGGGGGGDMSTITGERETVF